MHDRNRSPSLLSLLKLNEQRHHIALGSEDLLLRAGDHAAGGKDLVTYGLALQALDEGVLHY